MGLASSKIALSSVKSSNLMVRRPKARHFLFSPRLCISVLQQNPQKYCYERDVENLRQFMKTNANLVKSKSKDKELIQFLKFKRKKPLSQQAEQHLSLILKSLQNSPSKPSLVSSIILPCLETIKNDNVLLKKKHYTTWFGMAKLFFLSLFKIELSAKTLRRQPKLVKPVPGLDRSHKLSLSLAVELWKHIYGHQYVNKKQKEMLKNALSLGSNVYLTCKHTNRTLHVKYDNEIALAMKGSGQLSSGAKMRAKQVISVLGQLQKHSPKKMYHFCEQARNVLSKVLGKNLF